MTSEHALEVQTLFRGVVIGTKYVLAPSRHSHVRSRRHARRCTFAIGSSARADAPVAPTFLRHLAADPRGVTHPLILATGLGGDGGVLTGDEADTDAPYAIALAPGMSGTIYDGARTQALRTASDGLTPGPQVALGRHAHARLECGAVTFLVAPVERAAALPAAAFSWRAIENRYHLGTALGLAMLLLMLMATPADPRSLALDIFSTDRGLVKFVIKPPVVPQPEVAPNGGTQADAGRSGRAAKGPPGVAGSETARERNRRFAAKGNAPAAEARLAGAQKPVDPRQAGVLGIFQRSEAARSIFEATPALGSDVDDVIGTLVAGPIGPAYGTGALDSVGTGSGGGGTGEGVLGTGRLDTMGVAGRHGSDGSGYGHVAGPLGPRHARAPEIIPGELRVRGTLDREIVRRIIRRHINEVRFCYEQELATHRALGGRMAVQFTIAGTGQVLASVLQSSTLGNVRVESCAVQAVRRWEFPKPEGGGLVSVTYPFVFAPAGLGAD